MVLSSNPSLTNSQFIARFEQALLTKAEWTHAAHIRMGWIYLRQHKTWQEALPIVRKGIHCLNQAHGNLTGYHETITVAFLRILQSRMDETPTAYWEAFAAANPDLFDYQPPIFLAYYSADVIFSDEARARFIAPDKLPLPC